VYTRTFEKKEDSMMVMEPQAVRPAVKLFNGRYTVESKQTGEHRTFWVRTQEADAEFAPGRRLVMLLTGSQNDDPACYTAFGFAEESGIRVFPSKQASSPRWAQFADLLWTLALDGAFSPWTEKGFTILMEGRCLKCDRPLTSPESLRRGIGPICAEGGF
jgi:hypothetical protein